MLKLKNIKLNTVFITGLVLILGSSMIFLAFAAVESIISLGAYATNEVEEVITKQASELFLTKTRYKANEYSLIFLDAAKLAKVYGNQVAFIYENIDKFNFDKKILTTYQNKFFRKIAKGNLYNKTKSNIYTVYAGKEKKVPLKIAKLSFLLSFLNPLFKNIDNSSDIYLDVFLMIFNDNLLVNYQKGDELSFLKFAKDERAYLISAKKETLDGGRTELEVSPPSKPQAGNIILTCGYRRFDLAGKLIIYAGIDISLLSLTKKILKINKSISKTKENIFSFIFDKKNRKIIACPKYLVNASKFETDIYNRQVFIGNKNYAAVVSIKYKDMIDPSFFKEINIKSKLTKNGILHTSYKNKKYIAAFSRMKFNDWVLCTAVPVDLLLKPVNKTRNMMKSTISGFKMNFMFLSGFFLMISILLIVIFFRKYLIIPIVKFRNRAVKMGEGNFGASVLLEGTSEIKDLGLSFNSLGGELRTYMKNVEKEIAKKTKVENEVKVARQIQQAILPRITNTYKNIGIELFAGLDPVKDVAVDFYDFFFLSE
ncbi:MAG TPA: hypothetical protein QF753_05550, partial [Victivallales bacterium]|nr:hypothetical protein [Victivallales bacterium]